MRSIKEADWKLLRELAPIALDRLCQRIVDEVAQICRGRGQSYHERFLAIQEVMHERRKDVAQAFDDMRRSMALLQLMSMRSMDLLTEEELARFSEETRNASEPLR